ncbi:MAG: aminotransferase class III-fold pyridoxal phosphate-dependent enzyme, partial [Planctomycetes bacterium]|nr:aminotransferase class III-fold pyridoxal phosphate-dependent enzyme [Planctomycetota bacterium]
MSSEINPPALMGTYARFPVTMREGRGSLLFGSDGRRYIDLLAGLSVVCLGHCPERVSEKLKVQLDRLWHTSNLYGIAQQQELGERLVGLSCMDQAFFCNSGTEAVEAALKLARIASLNIHGGARPVFVAMNHSFHGRTLGSLSVTGSETYRGPFEPLGEVRFVDFGDLSQLEKALDGRVGGVILEPLQIEGGLNAPPEGY